MYLHRTLQYSTVQYITVQYSTVQYSRVQYGTVQYSIVQYSTVQYSTVQYSIVQYSTLQYSTVCIGRPHYCWYVIMRSSMDLYLYVCGPNKMFRDAWKCHRTFTTSGKTVETTEESWVLQNTQIFWRQGILSCARSANLLFEGKKC